MAKKMALGKGIASLIDSQASNPFLQAKSKMEMDSQASTNTTVQAEKKEDASPYMVSIDQIKTNPNQPRKIFKEELLLELSNSIKENGVIQPLIVVKTDVGFELVAGERRLRASKMAGLKEVPVVIKRATDREKMVMAIIENVQRSDLNCVEEALAYFQLMEEYQLTQEEVSKKVGKDRSTVANFLRILKLPRDVVDMLQKELLSFGHAKVLAAVKEREDCLRIANEAIVKKLSVRETEKLIKSKKSPAKNKDTAQASYFSEKLDVYRQKLEQSTGYHFGIKTDKKGGGQIVLNFSNEAEFNDLYEYLLK
ncbi:ParB/RepB/Spo0J family partition protein [Bacteriovorax sp. Seq25_V]|uniref:ParB/RepB/Spo0J family partition protein n=1 Tax=Bacteriovorax sp. Seq25_V TaxID=1201288 RepID=UPI00038A4622|nr:ParB/RepB/Spo0J family partition protein [Bacteriovorax sp. Seq25_V]EQC43401.1 ParB-like protein [Bacteriovorax sp. Seq25_V]